MPHRGIFKITIGIMAFAQTWICANAATLPPPAKLCKLIAATAMEGNTDSAPKWKPQKGGYYCSTTGMMSPGSPGVIFMLEYDATGPAKKSADTFYFKIEMFDDTLEKDVVAPEVLSRVSAVFAAANAGPVPDDLVQAIDGVTSATVSTALGTAQTRYTPGAPEHPNNGATFEVQISAK